MRSFLFIVFIILLQSVTGCREELITGPVKGIITAYDQYDYPVIDHSGIEIQLFHDSLPYDSSVTDVSGHFSFDDLPYGKYTVALKMEGFIMPYKIAALNHIGGGVPFYSNFGVYEVPLFRIHIDSIGPGRYDYETNIYVKIDGDTILKSRTTAHFIIFASESPDVSSVKYLARGKGYLTTRKDYTSNAKTAVKGIVNDIEGITWGMRNYDSIYVAVYPLAGGQGYNYDEYLAGSLGPASNVIKCKWPK